MRTFVPNDKYFPSNIRAGFGGLLHARSAMAEFTNSDNFEGLQLKDVIPQGRRPWYKDTTLIKLNTLMLCALITQIASGYDSSMLNGMQSLPQWKKDFGKPTGTRLGEIGRAHV